MNREEQRNMKKKAIEEKKRNDYYSNEYSMPPECDACCKFRPCYNKYENKGSFSPGRGYVDYYSEFYPACGTRMNSGCPSHRNCFDDSFDELEAMEFLQKTLFGECTDKKKKKSDIAFARRIIRDMIALKKKQKERLEEGE